MTNKTAEFHGRSEAAPDRQSLKETQWRPRRRPGAMVAAAIAVAAFAMLAASETQAALTNYTASIDVAQATTAQPGETGSGSGTFTYESTTMVLTYNITYTGLAFAETISHIHSGAVGVSGPIEVGLPNGTPKAGMATLSASQENALMADGLYVNIHTSNSPSGAIRGQIILETPIPAVGWQALAVFAILICVGGAYLTKRTRLQPLA